MQAQQGSISSSAGGLWSGKGYLRPSRPTPCHAMTDAMTAVCERRRDGTSTLGKRFGQHFGRRVNRINI